MDDTSYASFIMLKYGSLSIDTLIATLPVDLLSAAAKKNRPAVTPLIRYTSPTFDQDRLTRMLLSIHANNEEMKQAILKELTDPKWESRL